MNKLSFVVIGAQKCGTTTLHEILSDHPRVALPLDKERPFFDEEGRTREEWDAVVSDGMQPITEHSLIGKMSPQYLATPGTEARIHTMFPQAHVFAILRDPVERTISHYRMCRRRGQITEPIAVMVDHWLDPESLDWARLLPMRAENERECCVVWSEYGRQITPWVELFGRDQVSVLFLKDLEEDPQAFVAKFLNKLGLDKDWESDKIGKSFFVGADRTRLSRFRAMKKIPILFRLWVTMVNAFPPRVRTKLLQWNEGADKRDSAGMEIEDEVRTRLREHFKTDRKILDGLGYALPWL